MLSTRRDFSKLALAAWPAAQLSAKPNSNFGGVTIGVITYSFRELPSRADQVLGYCLDCGISGIEMMSTVAESFAGAPGRKEEVSAWRQSASMDKFKELRKMFEKAGVKIYAFKLPPTMAMPDAEYAYIWNVAETLGANHITMELPTAEPLLDRVARYAAERKLSIAFHTHGQGGDSNFDKVLGVSKYTALNLDVGHYFGVNGKSPVTVMEKYHDRIASLHLKDRKGPTDTKGPRGGGANMPWGQGETPLKEILQSMKRNKYKFPASIEYEYRTPEGSDVVSEVKKCVKFCAEALK